MAIKYHWVIYVGIVLVAAMLVLAFLKSRHRDAYAGGKRVAGVLYSRDEKYYKRKLYTYRYGIVGVLILCAMTVGMSFLLMARPYTKERVQDEKYCRDIMLCIDISTSVDYLNENLLEKLKNTVDELQGERFGIVLFNTSPVLLTPLTDDYEYVKEQLDLIAKCLESRNTLDLGRAFSTSGDWLYYDAYITSGTLVGNEERGSSLIGDGLAAAAVDFSDRESDSKRTKVVIFSTDNDIQGTPIATLDEAADICKDNNVTVFGVGTKEMTDENRDAMKAAVEKTGGQFYLEEESGSFSDIVSSIENMSKSLVKVKTMDMETPELEFPFVVMLITFMAMLGICRWLRL